MCINVAFAFDKNYYRQAFCAIASLLILGKEQRYNLFLLVASDIDTSIKNELLVNIKKIKNDVEIHFIDMSNWFQDSYECRGITKSCYYRLMLHRLLPNDIKKVIYSDVDVIFNTDLVDIWNFDINNAFWASNKDALLNLNERRIRLEMQFPYWKNELKSIGKNYRNSGFLLLNLEKFRKENLDEKILDLTKRNYNYQDQDVLNILFANRQQDVKTLPSKYCVFLPNVANGDYDEVYKQGIITKQDCYDVKHAPAIYHFAGGKPWDIPYVGGDIWWNFVKKHTPYYKYFKRRYDKLNQRTTFIEKIFSIKNLYSNNKKHKVITILGIKLKFKLINRIN